MMIKIGTEVSTWVDVLSFLIHNIGLAKKGHSGYYFEDIDLERFDLTEDPFSTCCYTNRKGKVSALRKQYLNEESLKSVFSGNLVQVSMVGGPKWGSAAGNKHCMQSLMVDHKAKKITINFRNSDFLKKFLVDIYFVREILAEVGVVGYTYSCHFDNLTLRTPFVYLYLQQVYLKKGELAVKNCLEVDNTLIQSFLDYYALNKDRKKSWKSLERAERRMKELSVYSIIKEYL